MGGMACSDTEHSTRLTVETSYISENALIVAKSNLELRPNEGLVYYQNKPFTGAGQIDYASGIPAETIEYAGGKKHGYHRKWFENGQLSFEAEQVHGKLHGTSQTWWKDGTIRSESNYQEGKIHGIQTQWYKSGALFKKRSIVNGREEGLQRAWRENGKIYNNYEAKNGRIFGLKRSTLCYELEDEDIQFRDQ